MNIYYDPKNCGLEIVGVLDESGLCYEFNTFLCVQEIASGRVFFCRSSGCSCPTPFEEYHFSNGDDNNLDELKLETLEQFINEVNNFPADVDDRRKLIQAAEKLLKSRN
jgi:hypothetical protein